LGHSLEAPGNFCPKSAYDLNSLKPERNVGRTALTSGPSSTG
jgi:hypothetical protein